MELAAHRLARPGATVKPFVLMTLLETGNIEVSERLLCRRPLRIGGVRMDCAHPSSIVELVQALRRAGLDSPSGLVKEEASGRIEMPRDKEMLQLEALGDRGIEVTALELLEAYRKLALQKRLDAGHRQA